MMTSLRNVQLPRQSAHAFGDIYAVGVAGVMLPLLQIMACGFTGSAMLDLVTIIGAP